MLTKRLAACAALVSEGGVLCDVGTDHAYLPAALLRENRCSRVVVTDIHAGPLAAARRTLTESGGISRARLYLCDGLTAVSPDGITDVSIAGMGGETIIHILEECSWRERVHWILQPMTKHAALRLWLAAQGFDWTEQIVTEGEKFYGIFDVRYDGIVRTLTPLEQEIGRVDWQSETVRRYALRKSHQFQKLAQQRKRAGIADGEKWESLAQATRKALQEGETC